MAPGERTRKKKASRLRKLAKRRGRALRALGSETRDDRITRAAEKLRDIILGGLFSRHVQ